VNAITIHERANQSGALVRTRLVLESGLLAIECEEGRLPLPDGSLDAVMARYGKPLAIPDGNSELESAELGPWNTKIEETLELGAGRYLTRFRFRARFDVIARDYLAWLTPDREPLCELATGVAAALRHLAVRFRQTSA